MKIGCTKIKMLVFSTLCKSLLVRTYATYYANFCLTSISKLNGLSCTFPDGTEMEKMVSLQKRVFENSNSIKSFFEWCTKIKMHKNKNNEDKTHVNFACIKVLCNLLIDSC